MKKFLFAALLLAGTSLIPTIAKAETKPPQTKITWTWDDVWFNSTDYPVSVPWYYYFF